MTRDELLEVRELEVLPTVVRIDDLEDPDDRTLILGYTKRRNEFHLYISGRTFHVVITSLLFGENLFHRQGSEIPADICVPDGRIYPEACNFDFCKTLKSKGVPLVFAHFSDRDEKRYYGTVL